VLTILSIRRARKGPEIVGAFLMKPERCPDRPGASWPIGARRGNRRSGTRAAAACDETGPSEIGSCRRSQPAHSPCGLLNCRGRCVSGSGDQTTCDEGHKIKLMPLEELHRALVLLGRCAALEG